MLSILFRYPDSKVYGAHMGPTWGRQDPGGLHVGPMNFVIWVSMYQAQKIKENYEYNQLEMSIHRYCADKSAQKAGIQIAFCCIWVS